MNAKRRSTISKARGPPLTLQTSNIPNGNSGNGTPTPPASRGPRTKGSDQDTAAWVTRPQPEIVYDRLEKFFPDHDLDKPVIDAPSGGSSPTAYDNAATLGENDRAHLKAKHKKSIRVVASQRKKALVRQSQMETPSATALRRRSTKMWGSKVEEVIASHGSDGLPTSVPESPSPSVPAVFKWVKGELIGKGTYGRVYLAMNATTGEVVAVKQVELPKTLSDREDSRQQSVVEALKAESETLKDLDHVNIVQYLGIEETADHLSIFLEYVPGGSVASCLRKLGKFRPDVVKSFTAQILAGLEYLHGRGILHRDLKADNILIDPHGICRISDFGISKRSSEIYENDAYTQMMGSVFWMAPEVVDSRKEGYSAKVDIWSLGCLWLEMLAGHRPWNQDDFLAVVYKLGERQEAPPVPEGVELTLQGENFRSKCFAVNPKERPTATELRYHEYLELPDNWVFTGLP
ncbi:kinase-like protein [Sistotremastrum niveocremeum HHB9708]|uniref:Kinase-like protein n=2 Tax=Sistotremastraceae TaxID=3402574 RepID=A0A164XME8_9AGAM|nr:kinase-like protein [Sistotremastrum niveocremeum HHB9708]KZT44545.1 kinase-like protein [Sistotremastrum suecicum HHB10207 ss-3]